MKLTKAEQTVIAHVWLQNTRSDRRRKRCSLHVSFTGGLRRQCSAVVADFLNVVGTFLNAAFGRVCITCSIQWSESSMHGNTEQTYVYPDRRYSWKELPTHAKKLLSYKQNFFLHPA